MALVPPPPMVQEMTQFSSPHLTYDPSYILPHFKSEPQHQPHHQFVTPWESPEMPTYEELAARTTPASCGFGDGSSPVSSAPEPAVAPTASSKKKARKGGKGSYKHVPHREKPPHLVARRNARERRRVQAVNTAFSRLRKCVPAENRNKRLSKVKTLHRAIEYIQMLQEMLSKADEQLGSSELCLMNADADSLNKENEMNQRWLPLGTDWEDDNQNSCLSFYDDFAEPIQS